MAKKNFNALLKTQRQLLFWSVIIAVALAATFYILYLNNSFHKEYSESMAKLSQPPNFGPRSRVYVDFGDGVKRVFEGKVLNDMAIKYILVASSEAGAFKLIFSKDQKKVITVGATSNTAKEKWRIYLNNQSEPIVSVSFVIKPGDRVNLVYK